jgi:two-component system, NarL family, sensor kinase
MRKIFFIFYLLVSSMLLYGHYEISRDSLLRLLPKAKEDTNKVKILLDIEKKYFNANLDSALYYNKICEKLILKINAQQIKHQCFHEFVKIYHAKRDFKNALVYCLKSINVAKQNKNLMQQATSYRALFNVYHNLNMNDSAVKYAVYSIKLSKELNDTANIAGTYGNLCWIYRDLSQHNKAIDYGLKGIKYGEQYTDTVGWLVSLNNLALCYQDMNQNDKAIELYKKQLEIGKQIKRKRSIRNALENLPIVYYYLGDEKNLEKTTTLLNEFNDKNSDMSEKDKCQQNITNAYKYIYQKKFLSAEEQLFKGLKIANKDSLTDQLLIIYNTLSQIKFAQHNFVVGISYQRKWDSTSRADNNIHLSEYATELEKKYETEKKEARIHHLLAEKKIQSLSNQRKKILIYILIASLFTLIIIVFLLYRNYQQKQKLQQQKIKKLETEKQLETTEAVLKGEEQERTRIAKDLHDGLGGLLSGIKYSFTTMRGNLIMTPENHQAFERSMDMLDSSIKEMRRVAHNMMPEALLKFGLDTALRDFCNDINLSGALKINYQSLGFENVKIDETTCITLYRIVQELINNTIKHAKATSAIVQITKTNNLVTLTVEDDGRGFDTNILKIKKGIGWTNIQNRVEFIKGKLDITSKECEGTSVQIELSI